MHYIINVSEIIPRLSTAETRHFCEIRLAPHINEESARHIMQSFEATWPIKYRVSGVFAFKLISVEERDVYTLPPQ